LLGALELNPLEVTGIYQTLAAGGFYQPLRAIRAVTTAQGAPLDRYGLNVEEAVDPRANYLVVRAMQEVFATGTARSARAAIPAGGVAAGKTGTTDDLRDSWFAGFSGDRLAVVWVGRDDNRSAKLTGASGALKVWSTLFSTSKPRVLVSKPPPGIVFRAVDTTTGFVSDDVCPPSPLSVQRSETLRATSDELPFMQVAVGSRPKCDAVLDSEESNAENSLFGWPWGSASDTTDERTGVEQQPEQRKQRKREEAR
jgi:membrane peptidoglycan carboxypeptidase